LRTQAPRWSSAQVRRALVSRVPMDVVLESLRYRLSTLERQWHMHFCADKSCTSHQADAGHCHAESCSGQQPDIDSDAAECEPGIRRAGVLLRYGPQCTNENGRYQRQRRGDVELPASKRETTSSRASHWQQHCTRLQHRKSDLDSRPTRDLPGAECKSSRRYVNVPVNVVASLADESANSGGGRCGQSVTFSLGSATALRRPTTPATPRARSRRRRPAPPP